MRRFLLAWFCLLSISISAQETEHTLYELLQKINTTEKGERLLWLDSLSTHLRKETGFQSDAIARETVDYALELDSLRIAVKNTAYLIYFQNNITRDLEEGNRIFLDFLAQAEMCTDHSILSRFYLEGADNYLYSENQEKAIEFYTLSEKEAFLAGDTLQMGVAKMYKGNALSFMGKFSEASEEFQDALEIFQKMNDIHYVISAKSFLSDLYSQNSFYEEAKKERDEGIALAKKIGSYGHLSAFYYNTALVNKDEGAYKEAITNLKMALDAGRKTDNPQFYESTALTGLVIAYSEVDSISKAEFYLREFEDIYKNRIENVKELHLDALMHLAYARKEYVLALKYGKEFLKLKSSGTNFENIQFAEQFVSKVYEALGDTDQAYAHFKRYTQIKDSIGKIKNVKALTYYQTLYETNKRDLKIQEQQANIALLDAKNKRSNQLLLFGGLGLLLIFGVIVLARSRNAARRRQNMQIAFSQDLINAQEEERTRIARELHDSVGQKIMLLAKQTKTFGNHNMQSLATNTLDELRTISRGLHPATLDRLGLTAAIITMINEVDAHTNIFFTNEIDTIDLYLPKEASLHLYRILQEILNNMVKHADAKVASVHIAVKKQMIEVVVKDDGNGFNYVEKIKSKTSLGMRTLMERASILNATLHIKTKPNHGTKVTLLIPIQHVS